MALFNRLFQRPSDATAGSLTELSPQADEASVAQFLKECVPLLDQQNRQHDQSWGMSTADWQVDQSTGLIQFTRTDELHAQCPVQIIGVRSQSQRTWRWSWSEEEIETPLQQAAWLARRFGTEYGQRQFTQPEFEATPEQCWAMTAVAARLWKGEGAVRGDYEDLQVYMVFGIIRVSALLRV